MQKSSQRVDEPVDPSSRWGSGIENRQLNDCSRHTSRRRRLGDLNCNHRTRRNRPTPVTNNRWPNQQLLLAMVLLVLLALDDSMKIASAFPISQFASRSLSIPATPSLVPSKTRQNMQFPRISDKQTRRGDLHQRFSASSSSTSLNEKSDETKPNYKWTSQTLALALPALVGMLVDPLLSMMDTAYVGNLGSSTELAALGACTSIFHLAFNAFRATTAATTSLVGNASTKLEKRQIVKISLSLGLVMGLGVGTFLRTLGPWCLAAMGISGAASPLFRPGLSYLRTRSLAAPAVLAITVSEGAFRGYGDTKIPLLASGTAALVNLLLDPILMLPPLSRGVQGAAAATAASQVGALGVYLWFLTKRKMLPQKSDSNAASSKKTNSSKIIKTILGANLAMVCKQGSLLLAWAYATAKATRIGQAHVAAHQVALSCWLVFALLQDGAGVASQVLLTKVLSGGEKEETKETTTKASNSHQKLLSLVKYMLRVSVLQGLVVTCGFLLVTPYLPGWFVPDDAIVRGHLQKLLPHVAGQQLLVSLTLVLESLAVGGKQFRTLAVGTALSTILSAVQIRSSTTVVGVWSRGIVGLFAGRLVTAMIGTYKVLKQSSKQQKLQEETKQ